MCTTFNTIVQNVLKLVKVHSYALVMGLVVVLLVASPNIRAWHIVGSENFKGVYPVFINDEITYQARIKEVVDGYYAIGNPYIREHKDDAFLMPPIAELITASVAMLTGASVPFIVVASDVVVVFVDFILVYILFLIIAFGNRGIALLYTVLFFVSILDMVGRPISPQLNYVFLFAGMISIAHIHFYEGFSSQRKNFIAGLITGVTCFISPYFFTTLLVLYAMVYVGRVIAERSLKSLGQGVPWFLIGFIPWAGIFAYFQYTASLGTAYAETALRYGMIHTHIPGSFSNIAFSVLALSVVAVAYKVLDRKEKIFCVSAIATILICNWQNIITGVSFQFAPHYLFATIPIIFSVFVVVHRRLRMCCVSSIYVRVVATGILALSVGIVMYHQRDEFIHIAEMRYTRDELVVMQGKMDVFSWFREETPKDTVVYALGGGYSDTIPVYTENRVYSVNFYGALYPALHQEVEERWLIQHLFEPDMSTSTIADAHREYWGNLYTDSYDSVASRKKIIAVLTQSNYVPAERIPVHLIEGMYERWEKLRSEPLVDVLKRFDIDYILLSKEYPYYLEARERLDVMDGISVRTDIDGERIYEVHK